MPAYQSYPPSLWAPPEPVPATGATAGIPGMWTPSGSEPPATVADLIAGTPNAVVANPPTAWTVGQYVQTATAGAGGQASWNGAAWVAGAVPAEEEIPEAEPEPEPETTTEAPYEAS